MDFHIVTLAASGFLAGLVPSVCNSKKGLCVGVGFFLIMSGEIAYLIHKFPKTIDESTLFQK